MQYSNGNTVLSGIAFPKTVNGNPSGIQIIYNRTPVPIVAVAIFLTPFERSVPGVDGASGVECHT